MGKKVMYKSFREQGLECEKNGNSKIIKCYHCGGEIILCKRYNDICQSKLCRKEREINVNYHEPKNKSWKESVDLTRKIS